MKRFLFSMMWFPAMTTLLMAAVDESQPASALDPLNGPPPFTVGPELVSVPVEEIERAFSGRTPPESMRMFLAIQRGSRMGPGEGWFGPAQSRYSFAWLAERHGVTLADGIEADKFQGEAEWFARLDRNRDGKITGDDLDWSDRNSWVQHAYVANRLFRRMDPNGDGRLMREEWLAFFDAVAQGRDEVNSEEMREAWLAGLSSGFLPGDAPTPDLLLKGLFAGEVGSLQEGPSVNDPAPDFSLKTHDGLRTVRLSEVIGSKPVVLVFGNFTCGPFRSMYPGVEDIYRRFKDDAVFLGVYVREAHPTDGWKMESNAKVGVAVAQPKTTAERIDVAQQCHRLLKPSIPLLVDEIDDPTGNAYSGMPARLYVIDTAGKVAFKSGRGPFGFKTGEMEQALMMTLVDAQRAKPEATQGRNDAAPVFHEHSRIELASNDEAWRRLPEATVGKGQPLPNWAKALVTTLPHTTAAMLELDHLYRTTPQFSGRERGLVRLSAAKINRSGYGLALARAELKGTGLSDAQLERLSAGELGSLEERERLIVRFAEQLSRAGRDLTDAQVDEVKRAFGEDRLVGLVLLTAYANFQDRLVHALALPIEADGPLPPLDVKFAASTPGGSLTPQASRPALPSASAADDVRVPQWSDFSFEALQARLEQQRDRAPRVAIPEWAEVIERLPKGLYNPDQPLRIRWSRLVIGRQPQLGPAWVKCLRVFGNEAKQDRAFEESVFWVVTRELRCFYCMGHCEMLMQVGGLSGEQIADRTRQMAEGNWSGFAPAERATFSLASQMTSAPWTVSAQDIERVEQTLGPERALDAIWWISRCQFMTKVSDTFQLQLERDNVFQNFEPPREETKK